MHGRANILEMLIRRILLLGIWLQTHHKEPNDIFYLRDSVKIDGKYKYRSARKNANSDVRLNLSISAGLYKVSTALRREDIWRRLAILRVIRVKFFA